MKPPNSDLIDEFINAMQLCIQSVIEGVQWDSSANTLEVCFDSAAAKDQKLKKIKKLLPLEKEYELGFVLKLSYFKSDDWKKLTTFLLLTRLEDANIQKLGELDSSYSHFLQKLGFTKALFEEVDSLERAAEIIFRIVKEKKMTLRELSKMTGLSQVALSNFKSGKSDIRLSSFLKVLSALGLKLKLK